MLKKLVLYKSSKQILEILFFFFLRTHEIHFLSFYTDSRRNSSRLNRQLTLIQIENRRSNSGSHMHVNELYIRIVYCDVKQKFMADITNYIHATTQNQQNPNNSFARFLFVALKHLFHSLFI